MKLRIQQLVTYRRVAIILTVFLLQIALWTVSKNPASVVPAFTMLFLWQFAIAPPKSIWGPQD